MSIAPYRASLEEDFETVPGTIAARLFETTTKANAEAIATAKTPTTGAGSMRNREDEGKPIFPTRAPALADK